jgi:transmembrane sensor
MTHISDPRRSSQDTTNPIQTDWPTLDSRFTSRLARAFRGKAAGEDPIYEETLARRLAVSIDALTEGALTEGGSSAGTSHIATPAARSHSDKVALHMPKKVGGLPPASALRKPGWIYLTIGVACIALLGTGLQWMRYGMWRGPQSQAKASQIYTTAKAERVTVTLPDGSTVTLNAESKLEVASDFGTHHRNVMLQGEGYFAVAPVPHAPFRVTTGTAITQVLGTKFNVRGYATDSAVQIAVVQGRVLVGRTSLNAGDVGHVVGQHEPTVVYDSAITRYTAWTSGGMIFDDVAFQKILLQLERVYDVEIRLADAVIGQRRLSGEIKHQTLNDVIQYFSVMLDARVEREGRVITFYPR